MLDEQIKPLELSEQEISDLIHLKIPEADARELLTQLTPDRISVQLLHQLIQAIRQTAVHVPAISEKVLDCCGTGGSGQAHFNTSTSIAFVLAAGGVPVVKFGNRAMSSQSGSFDFLEQLGFPAQGPLEATPQLLDECGLAFLYAPQCYPALAPFNQLRKSMKLCTVFNFLGPLLNPVEPAYRLLGISHSRMQHIMAEYLKQHQPNLERAFLVHAPLQNELGLDELSVSGTTHILDLEGEIVHKELVQLCEAPGTLFDSHTPEQNVGIFNALIQGDMTQSVYHQMLCLNAGAGFAVAGKSVCIDDGVAYAAELLMHGKVQETLERCRRAYANYA